jgi:UDP-glucose 4-epimerase
MKNKRVLITGGAGFIGSHLTRRLAGLGAKVSVVVKYKSIIDCIRLSPIWDNLDVIEADLRNIDSLRQFEKEYYDIVFHLAAYNHVGDSFLHVNEALISNAVATANLLEFAPGFEKFVYISTSESYGLQDTVPFREDLTPFPISPYAVGKYAGELYARMKRHQTNKKIICVRPFNTFGPYQSERAVIPELIIKCLLGKRIQTTEGRQTREFNYVDNIIDALISLGKIDPAPDKVINIGSNREIMICDLVQKIHQLSESSSELRIGALQNRPTEIWRMCADNTRISHATDWKPKISFEEGLKNTIAWFRKYQNLFYNASSPLNQL